MKQKVLFILPSLHGGGAERVIVTLLKYLDREIFELHLALIAKEGTYLDNVPKDVPVHNLAAGRVRYSFKPLLKLIHRVKPDTIFSTLGHLNLALIFLKPFLPKTTKIIVREANTVSEIIKKSNNPRLWTFFYKTFYKKADLIVCNSKYMLKDLKENFNIPAEKMVQVYNPVDLETIQEKVREGTNPFLNDNSSPNIVAIGRLTYQKGFDRLIASVPELLKTKPNAKIWILGKGPLENQLIQQRNHLGLQKYIEFVGFQENPYKWLKHSDLFVLSSYYEGLPNVLLEALACECPVVAIDHPGGTREIIEILGQNERLLNNFIYNDNLFEKSRVNVNGIFQNTFGSKEIVSKYQKIISK